MIHDAIVPVTCDGCKKSDSFTFIDHYPLGWTIHEGIEEEMIKARWIVINGKHYCSQECADEAENNA